MNNRLTRHEIKKIMEYNSSVCISIFMPTERPGGDIKQNEIRYKNLLNKAKDRIRANNLSAKMGKFFSGAEKLLENNFLLDGQSDGLALFLSPDLFLYYSLPLKFQELVVVTDRFHVKPLLSLFTGNGNYYILTLSQDEVKLYQGSHYSINDLEVNIIPNSISEILKHKGQEKELQSHSGTRGDSGKRSAMYHGHSADNKNNDEKILNYFRGVDEFLRESLGNDKAPLILTALDYLQFLYRQVNTNSALLSEGITLNPDDLSMEKLHSRAWQIMGPLFAKKMNEAIDKYKEFSGKAKNKVSNELEEIITASYGGRIDTLFVSEGLQVWGKFDSHQKKLEISSKMQEGDEDLLDFAAVNTILNRGTVFNMDREHIPGNEKMAAIFRF